MWTATAFPFANGATADPISGRNEGLLDNDRARENQPKVMFTNTAVEYWGGGRSAALVHTTPDGKSDLPLPANARAYFLTGAQHSPSRFPPAISTGQQLDNPIEYVWTLRALLVAMDNWVKHGTQPPASQHPRLADRTLVAASDVRFPAVAGVASPRGIPPAQHDGKALPLLVPQVGEDGNELAGVRTPEIAVPVATYTGWNFRNAKIGGADQLVSLLGSSVPLPKTKAQREAAHDPRLSLEERYPTHEAYIAKVREVSERLRTAGYLLADDVQQVMKRAEIQWEHAGMALMSTGR
jgi:hypothetical protein